MTTITYYYRKLDDPTGAIKIHLLELGKQLDFTLLDICLDENPDLTARFQDEGSSLQIGPYRLRFPFDDIDIQIAVRAYQDRQKLHQSDAVPVEAKPRSIKITTAERISYWLSNNYVWMLSLIVAIFVGLPFLAPVLMKTNHKQPAQVIYSIYSVFCHQLAFRSFFFYGEQLDYPRELAHVPNVITYEAATGNSALDIEAARAFLGNEQMGYKVAICQRDIAIYLALLISGLIFQLTGKKLKSIPWYVWVIFAILPIGLDGGSQLFSLGGNWPAWFPIRESTPFLRVLTGALFGFFTAWYIYPIMEENMKDIRTSMARKLTIKRKLQQSESK
jgi:Predicted membrane protein